MSAQLQRDNDHDRDELRADVRCRTCGRGKTLRMHVPRDEDRYQDLLALASRRFVCTACGGHGDVQLAFAVPLARPRQRT